MSIEQKIEELTEAVKALTAAIKEAGHASNHVYDNEVAEAPAPVPPAPEAAPAPVPSAPAGQPPVVPQAPPTPAPVPVAPAAQTPPQPADPAAPTPAQPPAAPVAPAPATDTPSIDEVNAALVAKAQQLGAEGAAKIRGMLQEKFGVTGISQIPAERLGEVLTAVGELS